MTQQNKISSQSRRGSNFFFGEQKRAILDTCWKLGGTKVYNEAPLPSISSFTGGILVLKMCHRLRVKEGRGYGSENEP